MSSVLFFIAGVMFVAALFAFIGHAEGGVPDIEAAADVLAERMYLDGKALQAANTQNREQLKIIERGRALLESCVVSQGYANDDSARFVNENAWKYWKSWFERDVLKEGR